MGGYKMVTKKNEESSDQTGKVVDKEKEDLKNKVAELEIMMKNFLQGQQESSVEQVKTKKDFYYDIEEELQISPHSQVRIMSLVVGGLSLRALHHVVSIPEFGNSLSVSFEDLRHIVNNHSDLAKDGAFIILSEKVVKALYLDRDYEKLLSRKDIELIVNLDPNRIYDILKSSSKVQLQSIIHQFLQEIPKGDARYLDHNKLRIISDFVGTDIYQLAIELNKM
jgi:hypothetical protein